MAFRVSYPRYHKCKDNTKKDVQYSLVKHNLVSAYYANLGRSLYYDIRDYIYSLKLGVDIYISSIDYDEYAPTCIHAYIPKTNTTLEEEILKKLNEQFPVWNQYCIPTLKALITEKFLRTTFQYEALIHYTLVHGKNTFDHLPHLISLVHH